MLDKGKRVPQWQVEDIDGQEHNLWGYRQKITPTSALGARGHSRDTRLLEKGGPKRSEAMGLAFTKVLILKKAPKEMAPGAYIVDRYGMFWNYFSPGQWTFDDLEKDLVYYEARHC